MEVVSTKKFESREQIMESLQEERDLSGTDMSGLDLSGIKLMGLNMKGADLHDFEAGALFEGLSHGPFEIGDAVLDADGDGHEDISRMGAAGNGQLEVADRRDAELHFAGGSETA